jgi:demethylmenaquinone methyltransferase/2-methoxy-6-polyprenyl-1,4-benzoquinol methylase
MSAFDHFGFLAPLYDRLIRYHESPRLLELLALTPESSLLDAGGGTGRVAHGLRDRVRATYVADVSLGMLRQAVLKEHLPAVGTPTEALPFAEATFDRVVMVDALHHVCDHAATAGELWRVLKPGGRLVIEEPDIRTLAVIIVALAEKLALMRSHFLAPPKIANLFNYSNARIRIERQGYTAWVLVEKLPV